MPSSSTSSKPLFHTYILPVIPFRRRQSSNTSTSTVTSIESDPETSRQFSTSPLVTEPNPNFLTSTPRSIISCSKCHAELALTSQIISKGFTGRHGRAYLVSPTDPTSVASLSYTSTQTRTTNTVPGAGQPHQTAPPSTFDDTLASHPNPASFTTALPNTTTSKPVPRSLVTGLHTVCDVYCAVCAGVLGWKYVGAEEDSQRYKVGKFILETRRTIVSSRWEDCDAEQCGATLGKPREEITFDSGDEDECEELFSGLWNANQVRRRRLRRVGTRG